MTREELLHSLETIHEELESGENLDADEVAKLRATVREIETALDRQEAEEWSFSQRISESAQHFEETHPRLTITLGRIADMLQQMGI